VGGEIGIRKYKFTRIQQLTVGGHARVETTCRKSGTSWRTLYSNCEEKDRMLGANPNPTNSTGVMPELTGYDRGG
jgi:hypothetical protein